MERDSAVCSSSVGHIILRQFFKCQLVNVFSFYSSGKTKVKVKTYVKVIFNKNYTNFIDGEIKLFTKIN